MYDSDYYDNAGYDQPPEGSKVELTPEIIAPYLSELQTTCL